MPPIMNPYDHYWKKRDGFAYHSRRQREFPADDPEYQAWLAEGHTPTPYPTGQFGQESRDCLLAILEPWGLKIYPLTEFEEYEEEQACLAIVKSAIQNGISIKEPDDKVYVGERMFDPKTFARLRALARERQQWEAFIRLSAKITAEKK